MIEIQEVMLVSIVEKVVILLVSVQRQTKEEVIAKKEVIENIDRKEEEEISLNATIVESMGIWLVIAKTV